MYVQNRLGVINCVRTIVIGLMTVRIGSAVKYKRHTLSSAGYLTVTGPMTIRVGSAVKCKSNTFSIAVHITVELYMYTCLQ